MVLHGFDRNLVLFDLLHSIPSAIGGSRVPGFHMECGAEHQAVQQGRLSPISLRDPSLEREGGAMRNKGDGGRTASPWDGEAVAGHSLYLYEGEPDRPILQEVLRQWENNSRSAWSWAARRRRGAGCWSGRATASRCGRPTSTSRPTPAIPIRASW